MIEIDGRLEAWIAGEDRPVIWAIHDSAHPGPEGVHPLLNGDFLTVFDPDGAEMWSGIIDLGFASDQPSGHGAAVTTTQEAMGLEVYGLQKFIAPDDWARMFLQRRKAVLRRFRSPAPGQGAAGA